MSNGLDNRKIELEVFEMAKKRKFWKTKTFWGCFALFIAGGLEAIGLTGIAEVVRNVCMAIGVPLTAYGVADRLKS